MAELVGLLLAAGAGARFDRSGQRLKLLEPLPTGPYAGRPLAEAAAQTLRSVLPRTFAVVAPPATQAQRRLHELLTRTGCELVINERAADGIGSSLACGVRAAPQAAGWIVALADMPAVAAETIRAVAQAIAAGHLTAAPFVGGRRGHPVGFAQALYAELAALQGDTGARGLLTKHPPWRVAVDDDGILRDVDTVADLMRAAG
ncbi:MAG: nucleotidyltransferase family protein [Sutterellaceae bacterium]|nr:nucleotidyltransferase family protein [Burkholderiaceae bacterium]MCX7901971.1 nucleotidyltransferase family protein [Burkholderiaceae bacterium]MDW8430522.1 nucleotidyltransferase family protein [Sutterellaceae bacterium]